MTYIKIIAGEPVTKEQIEKSDLVGVLKSGDVLLDLSTMTFFDAEDNAWKPIEKV